MVQRKSCSSGRDGKKLRKKGWWDGSAKKLLKVQSRKSCKKSCSTCPRVGITPIEIMGIGVGIKISTAFDAATGPFSSAHFRSECFLVEKWLFSGSGGSKVGPR
jgi:hypothetical protein